MINQVQLLGNVGKDPEVKTLQDGGKVANFRLATSERWKDKSTGEAHERTEWHSIVVWGNLASVVESYVRKGSKLFVQGQLKTRKWQDQQGQDRYSTEVVLQGFSAVLKLLDGKPSGEAVDGNSRSEATSEPQASKSPPASNGGAGRYDQADDIPF